MSPDNQKLIATINNALKSLKTPYTPSKPSPVSNKLIASPTLTAARRASLGITITSHKLNFNK